MTATGNCTPPSEGGRLRLILYDFDLTLSCIHLYHTLNEYIPEESEPETQAQFTALQMAALKAHYSGEAGVTAIFGGAKRQAELRETLGGLQRAGVQQGVVSHGMTEVVIAALKQAGLFQYFVPELIVGADHPIAMRHGCRKHEVVVVLRGMAGGLDSTETLLVDDDVRNLLPCKATHACGTLWLWEREGLKLGDCERLLAAGVPAVDHPLRKGHFDVATARHIQESAAFVGEGYFFLDGYSVEEASRVANEVPFQRRVEGVVVGGTPRSFFVLHNTEEDAARFDALLRSERLPVPPPPTRLPDVDDLKVNSSFGQVVAPLESPVEVHASPSERDSVLLRLPTGLHGSEISSPEKEEAQLVVRAANLSRSKGGGEKALQLLLDASSDSVGQRSVELVGSGTVGCATVCDFVAHAGIAPVVVKTLIGPHGPEVRVLLGRRRRLSPQ
eukprot:Hpha_TRINITY_DN13669_c0_g1::TRINITY_DN13669_c0_g1_i1::g.122449::m.122449